MAQETYTKAEKYAEWDALGEDAVRTKFELGHFGTGGDKHTLARMWLDQKVQDQSVAEKAESLAIATSAKDAAWAAADAARAIGAGELARRDLDLALAIGVGQSHRGPPPAGVPECRAAARRPTGATLPGRRSSMDRTGTS